MRRSCRMDYALSQTGDCSAMRAGLIRKIAESSCGDWLFPLGPHSRSQAASSHHAANKVECDTSVAALKCRISHDSLSETHQARTRGKTLQVCVNPIGHRSTYRPGHEQTPEPPGLLSVPADEPDQLHADQFCRPR